METEKLEVGRLAPRTTRRRFLVIASSQILAGIGLASCAPAPAPAQPPAKAAEAQVAPGKAASPVTLTWIEWITPEIFEEKMKPVLDQFEKDHPSIKIERQSSPFAPVHDKVIALHAAKQLPDIITINPPWAPGWANAGIIQPLTPFMEKEGPDFYKQFAPAFMQKQKDHYLLIPITVIPVVLYYNNGLFTKFGIEKPPDTWDEEIPIAQRCTSPGENLYAYTSGMGLKSPYNGGPIEVEPRIWQNGGRIVDESGKFAFNDPKGIEALQHYLDLVNQHNVVSPGTLTNQENNKTENFAAGQNALMIDNIAHLALYRKRQELDFGIAPLPKKTQRGSNISGWTLGMSSQTTHPAEAWAFIKWLTGPVGNKLFAESSGQLPGNISLGGGSWEADPILKIAIEVAKDPTTRTRVMATEHSRIFTTHVQAALVGQESAKEALDAAKEEMDKVAG
jgi:ABC-type glycerol-3-phosphate transport system substrate-binding protein